MYLLQSVASVILWRIALSASIPSSFVVHEKRDFTPPEWVKQSRAPSNTMVSVRLGIAQRNIELGHEYLMDISDPRSPNFGKHWTMEKISDTFSPTKETVNAVREWLSQSGIPAERHTVAGSNGHVQFMADINEIEELLATEYHIYEHADTGAVSMTCDQYHLPSHIKHHIDFVTPSIGFESARTLALNKRTSSIAALPSIRIPAPPQLKEATLDGNLTSCDQAITPACVKGELNTILFWRD